MKSKIVIKNLYAFYEDKSVLSDINLQIPEKRILAIIGSSGSGKSTLLRCMNRMNELSHKYTSEGDILLDNENIRNISDSKLRTRIGMVFQEPNPFPQSIYNNVAYGPRIHKMYRNQKELDDIVNHSLQEAGLWQEVKNRLSDPAMQLSGGQKQRLCIARALAVTPEVLLLDEPCASLDHISTAVIEELIVKMSKILTIIIITHSMSQAARISQKTAFLKSGRLIECNSTVKIFTSPKNWETKQYITGGLDQDS